MRRPFGRYARLGGPIVGALAGLGLAAGAGHAQQMQPKLAPLVDLLAGAAVHSVTYGCSGGVTLPVSYVNADPNFLAIVPVDGQSLVFASVLSGSGARYAAGRYEWWTKGDDAFLRDVTQNPNAKPILECKASPA